MTDTVSTISAADRAASIVTAATALPVDKAPDKAALDALKVTATAALDGADSRSMGAVRARLTAAKRSIHKTTWAVLRDTMEAADDAAVERAAAGRPTRHVDPTARPAAALAVARAVREHVAKLDDAGLLAMIGFDPTADDAPTVETIATAAEALRPNVAPSDVAGAVEKVGNVLRIRGGSGSGSRTVHARSWAKVAGTKFAYKGTAVTIKADGTAAAKVGGADVTGSPNKVAGTIAGTASGAVNAWDSLRTADGKSAADVHDA